ncbi:MAG TPA: hypothetical protein PK490_13135, partial [Prosthecobacter sp.]|nr:hypothetical protein [Prosthecobacter sp.]
AQSAPKAEPAPAAMPVAAPKPKDDWQPTVPKLPSGEFTPPVIPDVETITENWTRIPPQAFPRAVVLKKEVEVKMSIGASRLGAGAGAHALAASGGMLTIAPTETSSARGVIAVTDTDFPDQIRASYAAWKEARIEQARKAWLIRKNTPDRPVTDKSTLPNGRGVAFEPGGKPVQNADGSYNLLLAVISAGQISDVDPAKVVHWGRPEAREADGKPTWVITVRYQTRTIFGLMEVDSHAHVRDGRLVRWVYDSGEPVP